MTTPLRQPLIAAADSLSFRVADLNEQMWGQATAIAINNTQVANVEPLKGLIALRELNLYSTPPFPRFTRKSFRC